MSVSETMFESVCVCDLVCVCEGTSFVDEGVCVCVCVLLAIKRPPTHWSSHRGSVVNEPN